MKYKDENGVWQTISVKVADTLPVGSIFLFGGNTVPSGWLICNGATVSRTDYVELFKVIGTSYGSGDGTTTFNLPDYRGKVPVGVNSNDTDFNNLGKSGGSKDLQRHQHDIIDATYEEGTAGDRLIFHSANNTYNGYFKTAFTGTGNSGNLQPYLVSNYIIKAKSNVAKNPEETIYPERIENENGTALKFADGTMICINRIKFYDIAIETNLNGNGYVSTTCTMGIYAEPFIEPPSLTFSVEQNVSNNKLLQIMPVAEIGTKEKPPRFYFWAGTSSIAFADYGYYVSYIAIGRWK